MIAMLSALSTFSSSVPSTVVKVTLVLAGAGIVALLLHRSAAAARHLVWLLALASCLVLTIAAPFVPRIDVPIREAAPVRAAVPMEIGYDARAPRARPVVVAGPRTITIRGQQMSIVVPAVASLRTPPAPFASVLPFFLIATWALGFVVVMGRMRLAHSRVASIVDDARRLTSADWRTAIRDASIDAGVRREVEVFESDEIASPMTSGFLNPVVIVPMEARHWDAERRHIVLLHELAHVARLDYLAQLVATAVCALFWFHPLVWFAAARLRADAEHAADDRVLNAGTMGVRYAEHLLAIARGHRGDLVPAVAVGMVRSSRLEGRFHAMLDSTRSRATVSNRLRGVATSLTLCAMLPIAGLRPVEVRHAATPRHPIAARIARDFAAQLTTRAAEARAQARIAVQPLAAVVTFAEDSLFEKTIDASPGERLTLDLRSGGAITIHGWDEPRIRVVGRLAGRDWRDTRVSLERVTGGIRLRSDLMTRGESSTSHEFEIWAPKHTNVQLSSAGGSLAINDLVGEFRGQTGGGGITIANASGSATLSTGGGEVSVVSSHLSGTVTTGGGELNVTNVTGGLRGSSGTGGVIVTNGDGLATTVRGGAGFGVSTAGGYGGSTAITTRRPDGDVVTASIGGGIGRGMNISGQSISTATGGGPIAIAKDGGEIIIDDAPEGAVLHTGGGRIVVRSSERGVRASTGGGDIELENVAGDVAASTGAGDIRINLLSSGRNEQNVDVESGRGRVVIEVPATLDARIELETAYTNNFSRRTNITSDFALENSETDQWDSSVGTPRRYVRAVGIVGNGRGLIRVRTVNGDVVLKRVNR